MAKRLILVMGVQRSGTSTLFASLASDKNLTCFPERMDDTVYQSFRLRPLSQISPIIEAALGAVLLKPLSETFFRSLEEMAVEYAAYDLKFVWIYRDPVNVLYSMHREGWLSRAELDDSTHTLRWEKRNKLALQFRHNHPEKIAIVRYEDCVTDPGVVRKLSDWLGIRAVSCFSSDLRNGRRSLPRPTQRRIDLATKDTLQALDVARVFHARAPYRWRVSLVNLVSELRGAQGSLTQSNSARDVSKGLPPPLADPSSLAGLRFWFDATAVAPAENETAISFLERAASLPATSDEHRPFRISILNGQSAIFFPPNKASIRRSGDPGLIRFAVGGDWSFLFRGVGSICVLFAPRIPQHTRYRQERLVLLRVGSANHPLPAFTLEWDAQSDSLQARLTAEGRVESINGRAAAGYGPKWRLCHLRTAGACLLTSGWDSAKSAGATPVELELGGNPFDRETLYYGVLAEVIIFERILEQKEELRLESYLKEKYRL